MAHQYFTDTTSIFNSLISDTIIDHHPNTTNNFFPLLNPAPDTTSTSCWNNIHTIMGFSQDSFFTHDNTSQFNTNSSANMPCFPSAKEKNVVHAPVVEPTVVSTANAPRVYDHVGNKKRKSSLETPESSSVAYSSPPDSENGIITLKNNAGKGKKQKCNGKNEEEEKPKDVVHVRARRGQATDSHSLAERVRRGKINERLRCLQDIVPGCHKTVGMAAMLDEIINYVQSLQNQVEFLSMKLTAASNFHDFNAETDTMNMMIQGAKAWGTSIMMQKLLREERFEEYGGFGFPSSTNQHGPFDHSFGCYPSLPNNNK